MNINETKNKHQWLEMTKSASTINDKSYGRDEWDIYQKRDNEV